MNITRIKATWKILHERPFLKRVYHTLKMELAMLYLSFYPRIDIIAIAGSVGKTTTKEALASVLKQQYRIKYSLANLDPIFNIPRTILSLRPGDQKLILEIGIEYKGDMDYFLSLIKPRVGILTRITLEHPQFLGTMEEIANDERKLVTVLPHNGAAVLNWDDQEIRQAASMTSANVIKYGWHDNLDVSAKNYTEKERGASFDLVFNGETCGVNWQLIGKHTANAAIAAAAVGHYLGMSAQTIREGLESFKSPPSRMNAITYNGATIINDAYNSMPAAMFAALYTLKDRKTQGKTYAVLATLKELGQYAEQIHREVGTKVAEVAPDAVLVWGENTNFIADEAVKRGYSQDKITQATAYDQILPWVKNHLAAGDTLLLKGSRHHIHLERIALALEGKPTNVNCPICPECI